MRPFNDNIVKSGYAHTLFMDYGGGRTCGMASHILDLPYWALDLGFPLQVTATGGKFCIKDNTDAPDTHEVTWQFPNLVMTWSMSQVSSFGFNLQDVERYTNHGASMEGIQRRLGYFLHGVNGALFGNYSEHTVVPQVQELVGAEPPEETIPPSPGHEREWLDCIRTREEPSCGVNYSHKVNTGNMLGNLALKVGRSLRFDPATETILDDPEATKLATPEYRDPWKFPEEYL
jgi:predicted dehydrogenase